LALAVIAITVRRETGGATCREIVASYSVVIARLDRATQYSRDGSD